MARAHLACWDAREEVYQHICQEPSGETCIEEGCNNKAGTLWTKIWCPDCDVRRLNKISAEFEKLARDYRETSKGKETS